MTGRVVVGGSRGLPRCFGPLVAEVVGALGAAGRSLGFGCCVGADEYGLAAAVALGLPSPRVFCVGGCGGDGFWSGSAPLWLLSSPGCLPWWCAGGPVSLPLRARLARRSAAAVSWAASGGAGSALVLFVSRPLCGGSLLAARLAVRASLPLLVFPCGFWAAPGPVRAGGSWSVAARRGLWSWAWRFVPAASLFPAAAA